jgi:hypothetical protein
VSLDVLLMKGVIILTLSDAVLFFATTGADKGAYYHDLCKSRFGRMTVGSILVLSGS